MIRIEICSRQPMSALCLRTVLSGEPEFDIVHKSDADIAEVLGRGRSEADVTVVGTTQGHMQDLRHTRAGPAVPATRSVIVVIDRLSEHAMLAAISSGIRGFVSERSIEDELVPAVRRLASGNAYLSPPLAATLLDWLAGRLPTDPTVFSQAVNTLTQREQQVLVRLGRGESNSEIAATLVISQTTVRSHVYAIMHKLAMPDRTRAALFGYQFQMVNALF